MREDVAPASLCRQHKSCRQRQEMQLCLAASETDVNQRGRSEQPSRKERCFGLFVLTGFEMKGKYVTKSKGRVTGGLNQVDTDKQVPFKSRPSPYDEVHLMYV